MIRRPPRSTLDRSSAASDVYKRQVYGKPFYGLAFALVIIAASFTGGGISGGAFNPAVGIGPITVSYTHLRAHETVLDLVCRLLLEKKKI